MVTSIEGDRLSGPVEVLGGVADEVLERLVRLLATALKIPGIPRAHVCALEVPDEDPNQVAPVVDLRGREMLEPGSCRVRQEQREIADDEQVIVRAT